MGELEGLKIQEKASLLESVALSQGLNVATPNRYRIMDPDGKDLFYALEKTHWIFQQLKLAFPDCMPWHIRFFSTSTGHGEHLFDMHRAATCTFCCFNRPRAKIIAAETDEVIGSITDPCKCIRMKVTARSPNNDLLMIADGGCCQPGLLCPCPFGPCRYIRWKLKTASGGEIGRLEKEIQFGFLGWKAAFAKNADNYYIDFSGMADPTLKAMAMAVAIFIDFRFYSNNAHA